MSAARRWWSVGIGVLVLVSAPVVVRALPVPDEHLSSTTLLHRIQASRTDSFSGYAETAGNVALPASTALSSITKLLSDTNKVRVWWRSPDVWRVATLRPTGETDLVHSGHRMVRWVYESKKATLVPDVPVRLPDTADLLPNELARHALAGARASELSRLPDRRLAGRVALGLRLTPADGQAAIGHVDVYADRRSGVPLRVEMYARGSRSAAVTTTYRDFTLGGPPATALRFTPPADARFRFDGIGDLAAAADRFADRVPPTSLAGLPARGPVHGSVGVYGRGPTVLLAVPLWGRSADRVRKDLQTQPGVRTLDQGILIGASPLRLLLADPERHRSSWLLAGTVTEKTLADAADQLAEHPPAFRGRP